jgi:hypothetical protein
LCTLTPRSRTGRPAASVLSSSFTARCAISSPSRVGGDFEWLRVMVVKSE